jgi:ribosomal protein L5
MTTAEVAIVAALGASLFTGLASLGVVSLQEWLRNRAADRDVLVNAVTAMLSRSMAVMMRAQAIHQQMQLRSGLKEGLDVTLRLRKPADVLEFTTGWQTTWRH